MKGLQVVSHTAKLLHTILLELTVCLQAPAEIEGVLLEREDVQDAAVVGHMK